MSAVMTTGHLIALAKKRLRASDPPDLRFVPMTDYRFAKRMGVRQNAVSNWQTGRAGIGRKRIAKFAEVTGLSEVYIFACLELEREKDPTVRGVLMQIAHTHSDDFSDLAWPVAGRAVR